MSRDWTDNNVGPDNKRKHSRGVAGTEAETAALARKGFHPAPSQNGDFCYFSPSRGLIWLFPDDTWFGERTPQGGTLEDYLQSIPNVGFEERNFRVVKTEGAIPNNLGEMTGQELYPYLTIRIDDGAKVRSALSELEQKGSVKISYTESFGVVASFEIHRLPD